MKEAEPHRYPGFLPAAWDGKRGCVCVCVLSTGDRAENLERPRQQCSQNRVPERRGLHKEEMLPSVLTRKTCFIFLSRMQLAESLAILCLSVLGDRKAIG